MVEEVDLFPGTLLYLESGPHISMEGLCSHSWLSAIGDCCTSCIVPSTASSMVDGLSRTNQLLVTTEIEETRARKSSFFIGL